MSAPAGRHVTTTATMVVLAVVVVAIGWWGVHELTKPFPERDASAGPTCSAAEKTVTRYVRPDDVTVSVFNAGDRQGFAATTMRRFEARGFHPGSVANAPKRIKVSVAKVYTTEEDSAAAELVARNLGTDVPIKVVGNQWGPGIDVFVGDKLGLLNQHPPSKVKLSEPITNCVRVN